MCNFHYQASMSLNSHLRWNPLRKKSGLMSVLHAQTKKGRLVSKHGRINTIRRKEEVRRDKHRYDTMSIFGTLVFHLCNQIPQGLLHLDDRTLLVLDAVQLCRFLLYIVAWICHRLVEIHHLIPYESFSPNQVCCCADAWRP